ncbi:MAG: hypothetical protein M1814_003025 [Vezdaea aestivalis]|nr:MAG: hypothetical protein M1814_003025 [Vezdaea aestivalis]
MDPNSSWTMTRQQSQKHDNLSCEYSDFDLTNDVSTFSREGVAGNAAYFENSWPQLTQGPCLGLPTPAGESAPLHLQTTVSSADNSSWLALLPAGSQMHDPGYLPLADGLPPPPWNWMASKSLGETFPDQRRPPHNFSQGMDYVKTEASSPISLPSITRSNTSLGFEEDGSPTDAFSYTSNIDQTLDVSRGDASFDFSSLATKALAMVPSHRKYSTSPTSASSSLPSSGSSHGSPISTANGIPHSMPLQIMAAQRMAVMDDVATSMAMNPSFDQASLPLQQAIAYSSQSKLSDTVFEQSFDTMDYLKIEGDSEFLESANSNRLDFYQPHLNEGAISNILGGPFGPDAGPVYDQSQELLQLALRTGADSSRQSRRRLDLRKQARSPEPKNKVDRGRKDRLLLHLKAGGLSYKEIRIQGRFSEAESTLRGRYRALTKAKEQRVRKPEWLPYDIHLLRRGFELGRIGCLDDATGMEITSPQGMKPRPAKTPWKLIALYIRDNGGSYHFGNATCRKKWEALPMEFEDEDEDEDDL